VLLAAATAAVEGASATSAALAACPDTPDGDGDGVGDACDPCTSLLAGGIARPIVSLRKIHTPQSDDTLRLAGRLRVPPDPPIDPVANGLRLRLEDPSGNAVLDHTIPPGAYDRALRVGWIGKPHSFRWVNAGEIVPRINGIHAVTISESKTTPGELKLSIRGRNGFYPVLPQEVPLRVILVLDPPFATTGQCGEVALDATRCRFGEKFSSLQCK
jgi:hypothetical protein